MNDTDISFPYLLHPVSPDEFRQRYHDYEHLYLSRGNAAYYDPVIRSQELEDYLEHNILSIPQVYLVRDGKVLDEKEFVQPGPEGVGIVDKVKFFQLRAKGCSAVINAVQRVNERFGAFMQRLEAELQVRFNGNVYLSPAQSGAFGIHYDNHDVFILQLNGNKVWHVFDEKATVQGNKVVVPDDLSFLEGLQEEIILQPGDLLYLPRGQYHRAFTRDEASVSLSLGMYPVRLYELLDRIALKARMIPQFQEPMPNGFSNASERERFVERFRLLSKQLLAALPVEDLMAELEEELRKK